MGHLVGKDIFRKLGSKIDGLETRVPWNDKLHAILKELYSADEADVVVRMAYGLSSFQELETATGREEADLRRILDRLTAKGLVMDFCINESYQYAPSPMVIGIFEFTMMRMGPDTNSKEWAKLLHEYMWGDDTFFAANLGKSERFSQFRALPHVEAIKTEEYCEVLDYEKASSLIAEAKKFSIGICSCRHEKMHLGEKKCEVPLGKCSQFDYAADLMIRHNLAREVSRSEMEENFAESKELGLVLTADNVQRNVRFVCHCCKCCCNLLSAISKFGYPNAVVTSNYVAEIDANACIGCGNCMEACPIGAVALVDDENPDTKQQTARVDAALCLGCGVCALQCSTGANQLARRGQRVIPPETTFERIMLQCLEKGTLQNQVFSNPERIDQKFLRAFVGAFLKLPAVKKALLSDRLRSSFLNAMKDGVRKQGKGWVLEI